MFRTSAFKIGGFMTTRAKTGRIAALFGAVLCVAGCEKTSGAPAAGPESEPVGTAQGPGLEGEEANGGPLPEGSGPLPDGAEAAEPSSGATTDTEAASGSKAVGAVCGDGAECASGVCEGSGCEPTSGKCVDAKRMCTRDLRPYCGCDGKPFTASGTCPGRLYRNQGACG